MLSKVRVRSRKMKVRAVSESIIIRVVATVIRKGFRHLRQLSLRSAECGAGLKYLIRLPYQAIDIYDMVRPTLTKNELDSNGAIRPPPLI